MKKPAIERMLELYGSPAGIAKLLGYSRQRCTQWAIQGYIPYTQGHVIEAATGGAIKCLDVWESAANARHH